MSVSALLRFAPVYMSDPKLARSLMVQRGALETIRRDEKIPVVIDHDEARVIGRVRDLFVAPDVNGGVVQDWYFASCELDAPPEWLRIGGGVSWSHNALRTQDVGGTTRLLRGLIREVSVLTPATAPAEGFARVCWVGEGRSAAREEVIHHDEPGVVAVRPNSGYVLGVR